MLDEISKKNNQSKAEEKKQVGNKENFQDNGNESNISRETGETVIPANNIARKRKKPQGGMQSTSTSTTVVEVPGQKTIVAPQQKATATLRPNTYVLKASNYVHESDVKNLPFPQKVAAYAQDIYVYLRSIEVYIEKK